jgi:hypothetical protein
MSKYSQDAQKGQTSHPPALPTDTRYWQGLTGVTETFPTRLRRSTEKNTRSQPTPVSAARSSIVCAPFRLRSRSSVRSTDGELEGCLMVGFMVSPVTER